MDVRQMQHSSGTADVRYREEMKHKEDTDHQIPLSIGNITLKERRNKGFAKPLTKGR